MKQTEFIVRIDWDCIVLNAIYIESGDDKEEKGCNAE